MWILQASNLVKRLSNRVILDDFSLTVKQGEIVGLIGPNGAGKTSCFHALVGLLPLDEGKIFLGTHDITRSDISQRARWGLGYLPQDSSIFRQLTVLDNICSVLELQNLSSDEVISKAETLLSRFSLTHLSHCRASYLSGGERRRLEIARSLSMEPSVILLDEPFAGVDPISIQEIQRVILYLRGLNLGVLITDHNVRDTIEICDRIYLAYGGKIIKEGTRDEILNDEFVISRYLGKKFII